MSQTIKFDSEHYKKLFQEYGYQKLGVSEIDFDLISIDKSLLQQKWLCHKDADQFSANLAVTKSIVTTGIGISGVPHMGTLGQIFNTIFLQKQGINTQFVLGDLDAYNGKNLSLAFVQELTEKYRGFIKSLGYLESENNILRNQFDHASVVRTMYLLAKYTTDTNFEKTEEELHELYSEKGKVDKDMSFRRKCSLLLMAADFIDLYLEKGFQNVLVTLGVDEHKYILFAEDLLGKVIQAGDLLSSEPIPIFSAMYTHIIKGFTGYPKMSKSFPESSINIGMSKDEITQRILSEDTELTPEENPVYRMMCLVSEYSTEELLERYNSLISEQSKWNSFKKEYVDYLIGIFEKWA